MLLSEQINKFNRDLELNFSLPDEVDVMNPYRDKKVYDLSKSFYNRFYSDEHPRKIILGINPGRLGGGVTGIPFTDPVKLQNECGIPNDLKKVTEPSAGFIYDMINAYGGCKSFYSDYFIYAVSPLGFIKNGLNYNYYDSRALENKITPFIIDSLTRILSFNIEKSKCFCLGNGKNYNFLNKLNSENKFFDVIVPLPHPRWIVQYRRRRYDEFIHLYLDALRI